MWQRCEKNQSAEDNSFEELLSLREKEKISEDNKAVAATLS